MGEHMSNTTSHGYGALMSFIAKNTADKQLSEAQLAGLSDVISFLQSATPRARARKLEALSKQLEELSLLIETQQTNQARQAAEQKAVRRAPAQAQRAAAAADAQHTATASANANAQPTSSANTAQQAPIAELLEIEAIMRDTAKAAGDEELIMRVLEDQRIIARAMQALLADNEAALQDQIQALCRQQDELLERIAFPAECVTLARAHLTPDEAANSCALPARRKRMRSSAPSTSCRTRLQAQASAARSSAAQASAAQAAAAASDYSQA
jgi:hypothetical protein